MSAGHLVDDDPERALEHAQAARALAGRVGSVREAVGVAAYRAGEFGEALAELRAARRITGRDDHLPVMADCERALGRPDRALALIASPAALRLDRAARVELRIVESGVRRDLGQPDAAVLALQGPELDSTTVHPWSARLWYAHAAALLEAGRRDEALRWFHAVTTVDDGETDAEERILELSPLEEEPDSDVDSGSDEALADVPEPAADLAPPPAPAEAEDAADVEATEAPVESEAAVEAEAPVEAEDESPEKPASAPPLLFSDSGGAAPS